MKFENKFTARFWLLNILQMLEKMAYWNVLLQMPIYLAQKDVVGGLHWEQTIKGFIFFWWALVQNFSPIFFGFLSDKYADKKILNVSLFIIMISYFLVSFSDTVSTMLISVILLGVGSAMFKPTIQGAIAKELKADNQSRGWGIYFMLINLAVFLAPPISKYVKEISWIYVFFGSAIITLINIAVNSFFNKDVLPSSQDDSSFKQQISGTFKSLFNPKMIIFIISMSGFANVYMQFYETLPNFIFDWTNTTAIAKYLPNFMLMDTGLGKMISYEWMYNLNSILVLLLVVRVSVISSKINILKAIIIGLVFSISGLILSGISTYGWLTIAGIAIYTIGEMITNPKFTQYLAEKGGENHKSMYLSFLNISFGIGLTFGALSGAWLYQSFAEKSTLAAKYLLVKYNYVTTNSNLAFSELLKIGNLKEQDAVQILFNTYSPYVVWLPFIAITIVSIFGILLLIKMEKGENK